MRRLVDIAAVLLVGAVAWAMISMRLDRQHEDNTVRAVTADVQRFQDEIQKHAAVGDGTNARGWPVTVDPAWFEGRPPQNPLLSSDRPWVEVAQPEQAYLLHPEIRMAADNRLAAFWYNPYQGVVRTRVPATMSDDRAVRMYNRLNHSTLTSIFQSETPPKVEPTIPTPSGSATEQPASANAGMNASSPGPSASAGDSGAR